MLSGRQSIKDRKTTSAARYPRRKQPDGAQLAPPNEMHRGFSIWFAMQQCGGFTANVPKTALLIDGRRLRPAVVEAGF